MTDSSLNLDNPFWDYANAQYSKEPVQHLLLTWQETAGVNINIALFVLWLGGQGKKVKQDQMRVIETAISHIHTEFVEVLRSLRRRAVSNSRDESCAWTSVKGKLLSAEIQAEQLVIATLYGLSNSAVFLSSDSDCGALQRENLVTYLSTFSALPSSSAEELLTRLNA